MSDSLLLILFFIFVVLVLFITFRWFIMRHIKQRDAIHRSNVNLSNYNAQHLQALDEKRNKLIKMIDKSLALINKNKLIEAEAILNEAYQLEPDEPLVHVNRGAVYFNKGDLEAAKKYYTDGLGLASSNPNAINKHSAQKVANEMLNKISLMENQEPTVQKQAVEYGDTKYPEDVRMKLKQFEKTTNNDILCLECGYEGKMGYSEIDNSTHIFANRVFFFCLVAFLLFLFAPGIMYTFISIESDLDVLKIFAGVIAAAVSTIYSFFKISIVHCPLCGHDRKI